MLERCVTHEASVDGEVVGGLVAQMALADHVRLVPRLLELGREQSEFERKVVRARRGL